MPRQIDRCVGFHVIAEIAEILQEILFLDT